MNSNPLVVFELIKLAQNPDHKMFGNTGKQSQEFALLKEDLTIDRTIKSILLSSVEVDGVAMRIVNPIDPNPASAPRPTR